jgi:hypothetical protein
MPHIIDLFADENKEVRQGVTKAAAKFAEAIGAETVATFMPYFKKMVEDDKWRVRIEAYDALVEIAKNFHVL